MANKLIYASDARRAILKEDPKLAYCIDEIPGVNAVEVVRCKGCKYSRPTEWYRANLKCCHKSHGCSQVPYEVPPEHFCSYGERKDNERKAD